MVTRFVDQAPPIDGCTPNDLIASLEPRPDRRNLAGRDALARRVHSEFEAMPGLSLTLAQAARLFSLPQELCQRLLDLLVEAGSISIRRDGQYICRAAPKILIEALNLEQRKSPRLRQVIDDLRDQVLKNCHDIDLQFKRLSQLESEADPLKTRLAVPSGGRDGGVLTS
jgi:hypothetical protein